MVKVARQFTISVFSGHFPAAITDGIACLSVMIVSAAKTAEPIEMPLGLWTRVSRRNRVLDGFRSTHVKGQF